jgi:hypothetical protein
MIVYLFIHHIHYIFRPVIAAAIVWCYSFMQEAELRYLTKFSFIFLYVLMSWAWLAYINVDNIPLYLFNHC